jgi:hypothetical protein
MTAPSASCRMCRWRKRPLLIHRIPHETHKEHRQRPSNRRIAPDACVRFVPRAGVSRVFALRLRGVARPASLDSQQTRTGLNIVV